MNAGDGLTGGGGVSICRWVQPGRFRMTDITAAGTSRWAPHRQPHGLWGHAARRPRRVRAAEGPGRGARGAARGGGERGQHIDTSDFYGPHVTNQLIREALHPIRTTVIVTKVGAVRGADASWNPALRRRTYARRCTTICATWASTCSTWSICGSWATCTGRPKGSIEAPFTALAELQQRGPDPASRAEQCDGGPGGGGRRHRGGRVRAEPLQSGASRR